jgi:uncharacterized damage-inducible protein DinB
MDIRDRLINYDYWANSRMLDAIQKVEDSMLQQSMIRLMQHLLAAQKVWYHRMLGIEPGIQVWDESPTSGSCKYLLDESKTLLDGMAELKEKQVKYSNSKGDEFSNSGEEIFHHVIIHGQHHRAQIAFIMSENGIAPPPTDFIFYLRAENRFSSPNRE